MQSTPHNDAVRCIEWIRERCKIRSDKGYGIIPLNLFDYQEAYIHRLFTFRELVELKGRQLGFTEVTSAYILCQLQHHMAWQALLLSIGQREADWAMDKARLMYNNLPRSAGDFVPLVNPRLTRSLEFTNLSNYYALPSNAGRSLSAHILVFDELAHQDDAETNYTGASATISAGNQFVGLSTANGTGNLFEQMYKDAKSGANGMHAHFTPWMARRERDPLDAGRKSLWYQKEQAKYKHDPALMAQEHPDNDIEAFIVSGRMRFHRDSLMWLLERTDEPVAVVPLTHVDSDAELRVWQRAIPGRAYVIGADPAEGKPNRDRSVAVVLDYETGEDVAWMTGHIEPDLFADYLDQLGYTYNTAYVAVERNNHGHAVIQGLRTTTLAPQGHVRGPYPNLYHHVEYDAMAAKPVAIPGWPNNTKTKPIAVNSMARAITELRRVHNAEAIGEWMTYVVLDNTKTEASGTNHDDMVSAYFVAEQARLQVRPGEEIIEAEQMLGPDYRVRYYDQLGQ